MVLSAISLAVEYPETDKLSVIDRHYAAPVFSARLAGRDVRVAVGRIDKSRAADGVVFAALYHIRPDGTKKRIGVCESRASAALVDPVDIGAFANVQLFHARRASGGGAGGGPPDRRLNLSGMLTARGGAATPRGETVPTPRGIASPRMAHTTPNRESAVSIAPAVPIESTRVSWVARWMHDPGYDVLAPAPGDVFAAVVAALAPAGFATSVAALRASVAADVTAADFAARRETFVAATGRVRDLATKMARLKNRVTPELKTRAVVAAKRTGTGELSDIVVEAASVKARYETLASEKTALERFMRARYHGMETAETLAQFKIYIQTRYVADELAQRILEDLLCMKVLMFSRTACTHGDIDGVLMADVTDHGQRNAPRAARKFMLMQRDSATKIAALAYAGRTLLEPVDLPRALTDTLAERRRPRAVAPRDDALFCSVCAVAIGTLAECAPYPCTGAGEWFRDERRLPDFAILSTYPTWRRALCDTWPDAHFKMNGATFASVDHYCASYKCSQSHPDQAAMFSIESGDPRARAPVFGGGSLLTGLVDKTYTLARGHTARLAARAAKFAQHRDLAAALVATRDAEIRVRGTPGVPDAPDLDMMRLRATLRGAMPAASATTL
jgi:predicted NAD-dependent protein-ADP-ribosyltransferase YbiA (DUF1768 family)